MQTFKPPHQHEICSYQARHPSGEHARVVAMFLASNSSADRQTAGNPVKQVAQVMLHEVV